MAKHNDFSKGPVWKCIIVQAVPLMIAQLRSADYSKFDMGKVYMFILLAILPVVVVYMCLSKYIIKGVAAGAVKG